MAKINIKECKVFVRTDIFSPGRDEFGVCEEAECYVVIVERLDGHRLQHIATVHGVNSSQTEEGFPLYTDVRKEARKAVERLLWIIIDYGFINDDHWTEIEPRYGSEYYQERYFKGV